LRPNWRVQLANAGSAALDQNAQHNDKENAGNNTNNCYAFHVNPPSSCTRSSTLDAVFTSANLCCVRAILTLKVLRDSTTGNLEGALLLNARSATLDQNAQHNDKEYAGNYPDNRYAFHVDPPSSCTRSSTLDAVFNSANSCCVRAILTLRIHKARLQATWRVGYY
jgi:uncharacterized protein (UPF0212 family)